MTLLARFVVLAGFLALGASLARRAPMGASLVGAAVIAGIAVLVPLVVQWRRARRPPAPFAELSTRPSLHWRVVRRADRSADRSDAL